jgi:Protein of unknown function (DUF3568)
LLACLTRNGASVIRARFLPSSHAIQYEHAVLIFSSRKIVRTCACCLLLSCGGCITASIATIGAMIGFAGTAATVGNDVYHLGKLYRSVMATQDDTRKAVRATAGDLGLKVLSESPPSHDNPVSEYLLEDDQKKKMGVSLDQRSAKLCQIRVDVGIWGSEPTAKLIMDRICFHLGVAQPSDK